MTTVDVAIVFGVVATSLLLLAYQGYRASPLARYPSYPRFASLSDLPYILLDIFHPRGPTHSIEEAHKRLGPIIRIGPNRLHILKAGDRVIKSLGRLEKSPSYAAFDFGGHQSLFSERDKHKHLARGTLFKCFTTNTIEAKKDLIEKHVNKVIDLIQSKIKCSHGHVASVNLMGIMQAFGADVASDFLFSQSLGALDELSQEQKRELPSIGAFTYTFTPTLAVLLSSTVWPSVGWLHWVYEKLSSRDKTQLFIDADKLPAYAQKMADKCLLTEDNADFGSDYLAILLESPYYCSKDKKELQAALTTEIVDVLSAAAETIGAVMSSGLVELYRVGGDQVDHLRSSDDNNNNNNNNDVIKSQVDKFLRFSSANPRSLDRVTGAHGLELDDGNVLPGGVIVGVAPAAFHRASLLPNDSVLDPYQMGELDKDMQHIEFGYPGSRMCVAKNLARVEMEAMTEAFVNKFDIVDAKDVVDNQLSRARDCWNTSFPDGKVTVSIQAASTR